MNNVLLLQALDTDETAEATDLHSGGEGAYVTGGLSGGESHFHETEDTDFEPGL